MKRTSSAHEAAEILRWAIDGAIEWQRRESLCVPKSILDATADYLAEFDVFGPWLEDAVRARRGLSGQCGRALEIVVDYAGENEVDAGNQVTSPMRCKARDSLGSAPAGNVYTGLRLR